MTENCPKCEQYRQKLERLENIIMPGIYITPPNWKWHTKKLKKHLDFICKFSNTSYQIHNPNTSKYSADINFYPEQLKRINFLNRLYAWWNNEQAVVIDLDQATRNKQCTQ